MNFEDEIKTTRKKIWSMFYLAVLLKILYLVGFCLFIIYIVNKILSHF